MPVIDFTSGYRDATKGATLKALQQRKQEAAEAQLSAMAPRQIASPWQGAAQIAEVIGGGIREGRAAAEENAGRQRLSELMAGGISAEEMGEAYGLDPELALKYQENEWSTAAELRKHGWDVEAATQRAREASELSKQGAQQQMAQQDDSQSHDLQKQIEQTKIDKEKALTLAKTQEEQARIENEYTIKQNELQENLTRRTKELEFEREQGAPQTEESKIIADFNAGHYGDPTSPEAAKIRDEALAKENAITKGPRSAGLNKIDTDFAPQVSEWNTVGGPNVQKNLTQVASAISQLNKPGMLGLDATGVVMGNLPEWAQKFVNKEGVIARDSIRDVVQQSLTDVLGGQFAQAEGLAMMERAFDPTVGDAENVRRATLIMEQLSQSAASKQAMVDYWNANGGTLEGYVGPRPDINALRAAAEGAGGAAEAPADQAAARKKKYGLE